VTPQIYSLCELRPYLAGSLGDDLRSRVSSARHHGLESEESEKPSFPLGQLFLVMKRRRQHVPLTVSEPGDERQSLQLVVDAKEVAGFAINSDRGIDPEQHGPSGHVEMDRECLPEKFLQPSVGDQALAIAHATGAINGETPWESEGDRRQRPIRRVERATFFDELPQSGSQRQEIFRVLKFLAAVEIDDVVLPQE
jgi:hypothetical protein